MKQIDPLNLTKEQKNELIEIMEPQLTYYGDDVYMDNEGTKLILPIETNNLYTLIGVFLMRVYDKGFSEGKEAKLNEIKKVLDI